MPFVAIGALAPTLAAMAHLGVLHTDPAILRHSAAHLDHPQRVPGARSGPRKVRQRLDILVPHDLGNRNRRSGLIRDCRLLIEPLLDPGQGRQDLTQCRGAFRRVVPIAVQGRLETLCAIEERCSCVTSDLRQPPPLLTGNHAQRLVQGVSQEVVGILDPASAPQRATANTARG